MSRTVVCRSCEQPFVTPSDTGRPPLRCPTCAPSTATRYRVEVLALRARVADLEEALAFDRVAEARARRFGEPGRAAVGRAVRVLAHTEGRAATRTALLDLAGACRAWAHLLTVRSEDDLEEAA